MSEKQLTREESHEIYSEAINKARDEAIEEAQAEGYDEETQAAMAEQALLYVMREFALNDLFFLLVFVLNRSDLDKDWLYDRCREVEANPNGYLDLWAREHYKSTIITFGLTIQTVLNDPDVTIGIFSHTRPIAKGFLRQIKQEFENNEMLKMLFPDILWREPRKQSPKWSEDEGIIVIRSTNPKEATIEAWGLVDGQPTSKHFKVMIYDDVVTKESVTETQIPVVTESWALSRNLSAIGGVSRYIGTRYHHFDTYQEMMDRQAVIPRIHAATVDGTEDGEPVFMSAELLAQKRREMGPFVFAAQMLQNPTADKVQGFRLEWLKFWKADRLLGLNIYILVDPASERKKDSDYTCFMVVGLGPDRNYRVIDMVRDRLTLTQKWDMLYYLHVQYQPIKVGYERYGLQSDIQHFEYRMEELTYSFEIEELKGPVAKKDRIKSLIPIFENGRMFLPFHCKKRNYENQEIDLVEAFKKEEYSPFPVGLHDDMLDCLARITDLEFGAKFPKPKKKLTERWKNKRRNGMAV